MMATMPKHLGTKWYKEHTDCRIRICWYYQSFNITEILCAVGLLNVAYPETGEVMLKSWPQPAVSTFSPIQPHRMIS